MDLSTANAITGGLTKTSKMPCASYSLPAKACITGSVMAKHANTICSKCYARKGYYVFPIVRNAQEARLQSLMHPEWTEAMIFLITRATRKVKYFRWHDSGDLQSTQHFENLVEIARALPDVMFWLPTQEWWNIIQKSAVADCIPNNLVIRRSMAMFDDLPDPDAVGLYATAYKHLESMSGTPGLCICSAPQKDGKCGDCRACWDRNCRVVCYKAH